jgi:quinol monooxygenase YgiN
MQGIIVRYRYDGDEAVWQSVVDGFVQAIADDPAAKGKFRYTVTIAADNAGRTHVGRWDTDATLKTVQSRDYFKAFSAAVQKFAGETLQSTRMRIAASTD